MVDSACRIERLTSVAGVATLHLLVGWALLVGLAPSLARGSDEPLAVFNLPPNVPPPRIEPKRVPASKVRPALHTAVGAAVRRSPARVPIFASSKRPEHVDASAAATLASAGTGAVGSGGDGGGVGSGSGAGGSGFGKGAAVRAQLRSGSIVRRDYPRAANGAQGTVEALLAVNASGSVGSCRVTRSSGNAALDAATCRLIRERFRFTPARDAQGNPVPDVKGWQQRWWRD